MHIRKKMAVSLQKYYYWLSILISILDKHFKWEETNTNAIIHLEQNNSARFRPLIIFKVAFNLKLRRT